VRRIPSKLLRDKITQIIFSFELAEHSAHFPVDILGIAKHTAILADPHSADASGPTVDILKKMTMDSAVVRMTEPSARKGLAKTLRDRQRFKFFQFDLRS
jgi:hypothetical protein